VTEYKTDPKTGLPDYGVEGRIVSRKPTGHKHVPDGMAIDSEENLWVAVGESGSIVCYDSKTGNLLQSVTLPVKRPTSCIFGGDGLKTLFVTTRVETGEDSSEHHGGIFAVHIPNVCGLSNEGKLKMRS